MASNRYTIEIKQTGAATAKREIGAIGTSATATLKEIHNLRMGFRDLVAAFGVTALVKMVDEYNNATSRLSLLINNTKVMTAVQKQLVDIAASTYVKFTSVATLYNRLAIATETLHLGQKTLVGVVKEVAEALAASGSTTSEVQGVVVQFTQAMSRGVLRGQEFNSVMKEAPALAMAIAKGLSVTTGELTVMAKNGGISINKIFTALKNSKDMLEELNSKIKMTVGKSLVLLYDKTQQYLGQLDQEYGITGKVSSAFKALAMNMDVAASSIGALLVTLTLLNKGPLASLAGIALSGGKAIVAAFSTPLGAIASIAAVVAGVITYFVEMRNTIKPISGDLATLNDYFKAMWTDLKQWSSSSFKNLSVLMGSLKNLKEYMLGLNSIKMGTLFKIQVAPLNLAVGVLKTIEQVAGSLTKIDWSSMFNFDISASLSNIVSQFKSLFNSMASVAKPATNNVIASFTGMAETIVILVKAAVNGASNLIKNFGNQVNAFFKGVKSSFLGGSFTDGYNSAIKKSAVSTKSVTSQIKDAWNKAFSTDYVKNFEDGLVDMGSKGVSAFKSMASGASDTFGSIDDDLAKNGITLKKNFSTNYVENFVKSLSNGFTTLRKQANDLAKTTKTISNSSLPEGGSIGFTPKQIADFTKRANTISASLEKLKPTYAESKKLINSWAQTQLDAIDKSWSGYSAYAENVQKIVKEKLVKAWRDSANAGETATDGLKQSWLSFYNQVGTQAKNVKSLTLTVVDSFVSSIDSMVESGKFSLKSLVNSVATAVAEMIIKILVLKAIMAGMQALGFSAALAKGGVAPAAGTLDKNAKGGAFGNSGSKVKISKFAKGTASLSNSVHTSPTLFGLSGGRLGLLGEAGPEAVMPLSRDGSGKLGVKVTNAGAKQTATNTQETQQTSAPVSVYVLTSQEQLAKQIANDPKATKHIIRAFKESGAIK